jgi:hypothetical protein
MQLKPGFIIEFFKIVSMLGGKWGGGVGLVFGT